MNNSKKDYVIKKDVKEISKYIANYYYHKNNYQEISSIKKQKSLYFLFVFWIEKYYEMKNSEIQEETEKFSDKLFKVDFQAWSYGPVVVEVYDDKKNFEEYKEEKYKNLKALSTDDTVLNFLKSTLNEINKANDFDLVDRSHEDKAWKRAKSIGHGTKMKFKDLLEDYGE